MLLSLRALLLGDIGVRDRVAAVVYLLGVGAAAVACVLTARPEWSTSATLLAPLAVYLATFPPKSDAGPLVGAAIGAALFPATEALRKMISNGCTTTGNTPSGGSAWMLPMWAFAGAFIVALYDAATACLALLSATVLRDHGASMPAPVQRLLRRPFVRRMLCLSSPDVACSTMAVAGVLAAAAFTVKKTAAAVSLVMCAIAAVAVCVFATTFGAAAAVPAVVTAGVVALAFPVLESLRAAATATPAPAPAPAAPASASATSAPAHRYDDAAALVPYLGVPPWLFPLWATIAVSIAFVAKAVRTVGCENL